MGVDWIPCRIEPDVDEEVVREVARLNWERFCKDGGWMLHALWPLIGKNPFSEYTESSDDPDIETNQRVSDFVLLKCSSFRVNVVGEHQILPLEWRVRSYRTILPRELPLEFNKWIAYRSDVRRGAHRRYLADLLIYLSQIQLGEYQVNNMGWIKQSEEKPAAWAQRPESKAARERILALPPPPVPAYPEWREDYAGDSATWSDRFSELKQRRQSLFDMARDWNEATRRGNWRLPLPPEIEELEEWIEKWLNYEWFDEFVVWIKRWLDGGYGLYRDCY